MNLFLHKKILNFFLFVAVIYSNVNAQINKLDSAKKTFADNQKSKAFGLQTAFFIADEFIEVDQYDSAQIWLNKIAYFLPFQEPSISSYYLSSRQAEVYYYNGLLRLGLQESTRALNIANTLKDNLLLADAYNFIGLFYLNLDSNATALPYFKKGIEIVVQPPYPKQYLSLSNPHHLYGNLAEVYTKLGMNDTAIFYAKKSLNLAKQIKVERGIAIAQNNIADNFSNLKIFDSAFKYYKASIVSAKNGGDVDVELLNYGGLAKTYSLVSNKTASIQTLDAGMNLMSNYTKLNSLFSNMFFNDAASIYKMYNLPNQLAVVLQQKNNLLRKQIANNNQQMGVLLNASLQNETRLLSSQIQQANQRNKLAKTRLYYLLSLIIAGIFAFIFYRYAALQKLQKLNLQHKISKDLHDDVGSSLSSLNVYSTVAVKVLETNPNKAKEMLQKISEQSILLMENISDIVWSMKTAKDETVNLSTKIKNFVADVLSAAEINYQININESDDVIVNNITARRNILMIIKEAVNNAVKYSQAKNIIINVKKINNALLIEVIDDGKGFDIDAAKVTGNGLTNMQKRAKEINGDVILHSNFTLGTTLKAIFPSAALNNTGW